MKKILFLILLSGCATEQQCKINAISDVNRDAAICFQMQGLNSGPQKSKCLKRSFDFLIDSKDRCESTTRRMLGLPK